MIIKVNSTNKKTYVHYASFQKDSNKINFDKKYFEKIINREFISKPKGGFWASPIDAKYGWKEWCSNEEPEWIKDIHSYKLMLKDDASILYFRSFNELCDAIQEYPELFFDTMAKREYLMHYKSPCPPTVYINFEKALESGIDAIEIMIDELYYPLYGWDCDSILIMNPDVIVPL